MAHQITLIPGDGIGPEVADATVRAVEATGAAIEWERVEAGVRALAEQGQLIPDDVFASLEMTRVGLKGPPPPPSAADTRASTWRFARSSASTPTFVPSACCPGSRPATRIWRRPRHLPRKHRGSLFRPGARSSARRGGEPQDHHSEGVHQDRPLRLRMVAPQSRKKVVAIHKANIMKMSDGLFLKCCREVASHFPDIAYSEMIVDNAACSWSCDPRPSTCWYSPTCTATSSAISPPAWWAASGLCRAPTSATARHLQAVHGTAPDIAGKGLANPTAPMQSAVLMLAHIGEREKSCCLHNATDRAYVERDHLTGVYVGGQLTGPPNSPML